MAPPRLKGGTVTAVRTLADVFPGLVWKVMGADYGMSQMLGLPPSARGSIGVEPRPVQGRPPRRFGTGGLPTPASDRPTVAKLRAAYAEGAANPTAVLAGLRAVVEAGEFGDCVHSPFVALDWAGAEAAAAQSSKRWAAGKALGPLDGIPVPVKDEHDLAGLVTRGGTAYRNNPADTDSFVVQRLRQAGALVYGKTHTTEWGMSPVGFNPHFDMPRNPYSREHAPGGSSTGSAAAVSLGLAPVAVGSDGGGSIRIPSALQGLFGLKPSFVRAGRSGDIFADGSMSHIGPIGQSVADLVDWMDVVCGAPDPNDPLSQYAGDLPEAAAGWRASLGRGVKGARIGIVRRDWEDADPKVAQACEAALRSLEAEGAVLQDVVVPHSEHAGATGVLVIAGETMGGLIDDFAAHGPTMGEDLRIILRLLGQARASEVMAARCTRSQLRQNLAALYQEHDLLALPSTATTAPPWPLADGRTVIADSGANIHMCRYAWLGNLSGLPAGSVPVGAIEGLPVGLQLMGDAWDEASVLAAMAHCERLGMTALPAPAGRLDLAGS